MLAVLAVLGLVTWWVVRLGIRPAPPHDRHRRRHRRAATSPSASPRAHAGTEAGDLGVALNGMLGRIEEAFDQRTASEDRLRRFIADASHELRTPVTTIRGYAELYRTGALREDGELDEAMRRTEQEAVRMGALVDDLLHLARLDQGRPLDRVPVDLAALAARRRPRRPGRGPRPHDHRSTPWRALVRARRRGPPAPGRGQPGRQRPRPRARTRRSTVRVRRRRTVAAVLEVADEGPGMAPADAARAFERFYRADASRQRHSGGSGLGLAIVEATVRAHGGTVDIDTAPGQGTTRAGPHSRWRHGQPGRPPAPTVRGA